MRCKIAWLAFLPIIFLSIYSTGCTGTNSDAEDAVQECESEFDCATGYRCINKVCVESTCSTDQDCLAGEECLKSALAESGICMRKTTDTDGDLTDGDTVDGDTTDGDRPVGPCDIGDKRCVDNELQVCASQNNRLDWRFEEECEYGCQNQECLAPPVDGDTEPDGDDEPEMTCTPGERRCWSNDVELCTEDGMEWRLEFDCTGGTCVEDYTSELVDARCGPKIICDPGMRICSPDFPNAIAICKPDGTGWNYQYCGAQQVCEGAICIDTGACTPNRYRCNGNVVEKCVNGAWTLYEACQQGSTCRCGTYVGTECTQAICDQDVICTPFTDRRCAGTVVQICAQSGKDWAFWSDCADDGLQCVDGYCQ